MIKYFGEYYMKPYSRLSPYMIGIVTGYILYRTNRQVRMPKVSKGDHFYLLML